MWAKISECPSNFLTYSNSDSLNVNRRLKYTLINISRTVVFNSLFLESRPILGDGQMFMEMVDISKPFDEFGAKENGYCLERKGNKLPANPLIRWSLP